MTDTDTMRVLERMQSQLEEELRDALRDHARLGIRIGEIEEEMTALARAQDAERRRRDE